MKKLLVVLLTSTLCSCAWYIKGFKGPPQHDIGNCQTDLTYADEPIRVCLNDNEGNPWATEMMDVTFFIPLPFVNDQVQLHGWNTDTLYGVCERALWSTAIQGERKHYLSRACQHTLMGMVEVK